MTNTTTRLSARMISAADVDTLRVRHEQLMSREQLTESQLDELEAIDDEMRLRRTTMSAAYSALYTVRISRKAWGVCSFDDDCSNGERGLGDVEFLHRGTQVVVIGNRMQMRKILGDLDMRGDAESGFDYDTPSERRACRTAAVRMRNVLQ